MTLVTLVKDIDLEIVNSGHELKQDEWFNLGLVGFEVRGSRFVNVRKVKHKYKCRCSDIIHVQNSCGSYESLKPRRRVPNMG